MMKIYQLGDDAVVTPRSRGYGDITIMYIHRSEVPSLSVSTGKNQSPKVRGALYIPTYKNNYKVQKMLTTDKEKLERRAGRLK